MPSEPKRLALSADAICELMAAAFARGGPFAFCPTGTSMLPMLKERRDTVWLRAPRAGEPGRLDVVLYRRADGQAVLHRVIAVQPNGSLTLCGDRQLTLERDVAPGQVLAVLCAFTRRGRRHKAQDPLYRLYAALWVFTLPLRRLAARLLGKSAGWPAR